VAHRPHQGHPGTGANLLQCGIFIEITIRKQAGFVLHCSIPLRRLIAGASSKHQGISSAANKKPNPSHDRFGAHPWSFNFPSKLIHGSASMAMQVHRPCS
jgi:hypothetical protein